MQELHDCFGNWLGIWQRWCGAACEISYRVTVLKKTYYYSDVIMNAMASQITGPWIVYPTVCSGAEQRKHRSSASMAFVRGIHRWRVNSSHKGLVTRKNISIWWRHHVYSTFTVSVLKRPGTVLLSTRSQTRYRTQSFELPSSRLTCLPSCISFMIAYYSLLKPRTWFNIKI